MNISSLFSRLFASRPSQINMRASGTDTANTTVKKLKLIPYNQYDDLIINLGANNLKILGDIARRFNGLCEIVCNIVLIGDFLERGNTEEFLKRKVSLGSISENIVRSHLLTIYTVFQRIIAYLFGIYPDNIFSFSDQWKMIVKKRNKATEVNKALLAKGLKQLNKGEILKVEIFRKQRNPFKALFEGHSLLVKKVRDTEYIFFDPNSGEHRELSFKALGKKIDDQLETYHGTDIFFLRGKDFLRRLQNKGIGRD